MNGEHRRGLEAALVAAVISGVAVFVNGLAVRRFDDATVYTTAKNLIAGALLVVALVVGPAASPGTTTARLDAGVRRRLLLVAVVGGSVPFVLFFEGLQRAASTDAAFIHKTLVVWVAVGATLWLGERITLLHAGAIALLLAGQLVLSGGGPAAYGAGEAMIALATLLWTIEVLVVKRVLADVPAPLAATVRMAGGSMVLVAWLVVTGDVRALAHLTPQQWLWVSLTGATLAGFVTAWYRALALAPATDVTAVLVVGAVITAGLEVVFRGAPVTPATTGHLLLIAGAIAVAAARVGPTRSRAPA